MLFPVADSHLFIADTNRVPGAEGASEWLEIGETEAIGMLGGEWEMYDATSQHSIDADGNPVREYRKGLLVPGKMHLILGLDPSDPGQLLLWSAFRSKGDFLFRIVFPGGGVAREWRAQVTAIAEVFDAANSAIKLQADLLISSKIWRSGAS